jgi:hypothetical protein
VPPRQPVNGPDALPRRPVSRSAWDAGGDDPGQPRHGAGDASRTAGHSAADSGEDGSGDAGTAPDSDPQIYLWNPGATTETFPALPDSSRSRPDD